MFILLNNQFSINNHLNKLKKTYFQLITVFVGSGFRIQPIFYMNPDPDPNPDPGKSYGFYGPGSATLLAG